jgi:hypothetical protein
MTWVTAVGGALALAGLGSLGAGVRQFAAKREFLRASSVASGTVVAVTENRERDDISYFPTIAFRAASGLDVRFESGMGQSTHALKIGDPVPVRYRSDDPSIAEIDAFLPLWGPTLLLCGLGVVFLSIGIGLLAGAVPV